MASASDRPPCHTSRNRPDTSWLVSLKWRVPPWPNGAAAEFLGSATTARAKIIPTYIRIRPNFELIKGSPPAKLWIAEANPHLWDRAEVRGAGGNDRAGAALGRVCKIPAPALRIDLSTRTSKLGPMRGWEGARGRLNQ